MLMKEVYEKNKFIYRALRYAYEKRFNMFIIQNVFYKDDEWTGIFNTMSLKTIVDKIGGFKEVAILDEIGKTRLERIKQWYLEDSK